MCRLSAQIPWRRFLCVLRELGYTAQKGKAGSGVIREIRQGVSIRIRVNARFASKFADYTSRRFAAATRPYQSPESFTVRFWLRKST
jgi:hypothetical protein